MGDPGDALTTKTSASLSTVATATVLVIGTALAYIIAITWQNVFNHVLQVLGLQDVQGSVMVALFVTVAAVLLTVYLNKATSWFSPSGPDASGAAAKKDATLTGNAPGSTPFNLWAEHVNAASGGAAPVGMPVLGNYRQRYAPHYEKP